jgi:cysteine desulfurase
VKKYLFFDNASTTRCCDEAVALVQRFASEDFGNPSSSHAFGQLAAKAIREARIFFAETFRVRPEQVIFTGSGSEADNLAVYGVAMAALVKTMSSAGAGAGARTSRKQPVAAPPRVIASAIEHPAIRRTVESLEALGIDARLAPVDSRAQLDLDAFDALLTPETVLVSIHRVNNIVGSVFPVEELAKRVKARVPGAIFHTDAVQAFGRVSVPVAPSSVDLVSISAHKIEGPKGVGALIVLDPALLKGGLRPLVWGGDQEGGFRSGTQSAGLIAGFHAAAKRTLERQTQYHAGVEAQRARLRELLNARGLLGKAVTWNSPDDAVPNVVSLSVPGYPSGPLAKLLEERGCLVSTGSACSSQKVEPDTVLAAMGLPVAVQGSMIRVSFSGSAPVEDVDTLVAALDESITLMGTLLGRAKRA